MRGQRRAVSIFGSMPVCVSALRYTAASRRRLFFFHESWHGLFPKQVNPKSIHLIIFGVLRFLKIDLGLTTHHRGRRVCDVKPDTCGNGTCSCRMRYMDPRAVTAHGKNSACARHDFYNNSKQNDARKKIKSPYRMYATCCNKSERNDGDGQILKKTLVDDVILPAKSIRDMPAACLVCCVVCSFFCGCCVAWCDGLMLWCLRCCFKCRNGFLGVWFWRRFDSCTLSFASASCKEG